MLRQPLAEFAAEHVRDVRLRQILGYPAVLLGTEPARAPSIYHLMSHLDLADGVRYPLGGFAGLVDRLAALAEDAGARLVTGAQVTAINTAVGVPRPYVTGVRHRKADGVSSTLEADIVVSAADLHHTETRLLPPWLRTHPEESWEQRDPGPGAVLALLGVRGELPQLAHHNLFFTADWDADFARVFGTERGVPDRASLYVCRPSATDPSVAPPGHESLFVFVPVPATADGRPGDADRDALVGPTADAAIAQISVWAGIPDLADRIVVRRTIGPADFVADFNAWRGGAFGLAHTLRQSAVFRPGTASKRVDGLLYVGSSTLPGIGLPMCLISAELAAKRLRGERRPGPLAEPIRAVAGAEHVP